MGEAGGAGQGGGEHGAGASHCSASLVFGFKNVQCEGCNPSEWRESFSIRRSSCSMSLPYVSHGEGLHDDSQTERFDDWGTGGNFPAFAARVLASAARIAPITD